MWVEGPVQCSSKGQKAAPCVRGPVGSHSPANPIDRFLPSRPSCSSCCADIPCLTLVCRFLFVSSYLVLSDLVLSSLILSWLIVCCLVLFCLGLSGSRRIGTGSSTTTCCSCLSLNRRRMCAMAATRSTARPPSPVSEFSRRSPVDRSGGPRGARMAEGLLCGCGELYLVAVVFLVRFRSNCTDKYGHLEVEVV